MLSEATVQMVTAFVDGELNPRQRQAVLRFLVMSAEARELLMQLQENAHKVRELPRHKLPPAFTAEVIDAVLCAKPATPVATPVVKPVLAPVVSAPVGLRWLPYAAAGLAAAVLFPVAITTVLYL